MSCEAVKELLWMYLEKETTAEEAEKIEKHLAECAACREELKAQKAIMETLSGLPDEELPEGYHGELMQKLRAEAAPNVVPFPQKKKQPVWKQLSMIAAAVLVVVAAGGINGMLEMRQGQKEAVSQMAADTAAPMEDGILIEAELEESIAEAQNEPAEMKTSSKENVPAAGAVAENGAVKKEKASGVEMAGYAAEDAAAVPQMASVEETAETTASYDLRSRQTAAVTDAVILKVENINAALAEVQKAIAEAGGHEEAAAVENAVIAVIPAENFDGFCKVLAGIGEVDWTMQEQLEAGATERRIEIQLEMK